MPNAIAITAAAGACHRRRWWSDSFWAAVANLSQAVGPFAGLLLLARWHGLEAAGQFAYAQAVTAPLVQLLNFQLKALILTHAAEELPLSVASSIRAISFPPVLALSALLAVLVGPLVGLWMAARALDSWAEVFQANQQRLAHMPLAAASVALRAAALILCLVLLPNPASAAVCYFVVTLLLLLFWDWRFTPLGLHLHWPTLRPVLHRGSLLGLMLFLQATAASLPRIVLEDATDAATLGLFASLCVLVQVGNLLASSFGQGLLPFLPDAPLRRIAFWCTIPFCVALAALFVEASAAPLVLEWLHLTPHPAARQLLLSLALAQLTIWPAAMIGYALTARRLYHQSLTMGIILILASAAGSVLLIPRWGSTGAAFVMALSGAITLLWSFWFLARQEAVR